MSTCIDKLQTGQTIEAGGATIAVTAFAIMARSFEDYPQVTEPTSRAWEKRGGCAEYFIQGGLAYTGEEIETVAQVKQYIRKYGSIEVFKTPTGCDGFVLERGANDCPVAGRLYLAIPHDRSSGFRFAHLDSERFEKLDARERNIDWWDRRARVRRSPYFEIGRNPVVFQMKHGEVTIDLRGDLDPAERKVIDGMLFESAVYTEREIAEQRPAVVTYRDQLDHFISNL